MWTVDKISTVMNKYVDRVGSQENEPRVQTQDAKIQHVASIELLKAEHIQAFQELADKPMPPLPTHFLKLVKRVQN